MSTNINLKNSTDTTFSITHSDGANTKVLDSKDIAVAVDTVADFPANPNNGDVVIVRDLNRGGTFIYDSSEVANSNDGTNFDGWIRQYSGAVNVKWFGAKGDGVTDDTNAINLALIASSNVYFPIGTFLLETPLDFSVRSSFILEGAGKYSTTLKAKHTGDAVIDLYGNNWNKLSNFVIDTDSTIYPKTAIITARTSANETCGFNIFSNLEIVGKYSEVGVYSIASEENQWTDCYIRPSLCKYAFYTASSDELDIKGVSSTNTTNAFTRVTFATNFTVTTGTESPLYIKLDGTDLFTFNTCYFVANDYAYNVFDCNDLSGTTKIARISFIGCSGERLSGVTTYIKGVVFIGTNASDNTVSDIRYINSYYNLVTSDAVYVDTASKTILSGFEYIDCRINGATNCHNQNYYKLVNSRIQSLSGDITCAELASGNYIISDLRNKRVVITASKDYGNMLVQYNDGAIANSSKTVNGISLSKSSVYNLTGNSTVPPSLVYSAYDAILDNCLYTNKDLTTLIRVQIPYAKAGRTFKFFKIGSGGVRLGPRDGSGDIFRSGESINSYFSNTTTEVGSSVVLYCVVDGVWMVQNTKGTWGLASS